MFSPCDSDWRTQTKVYLESPVGNMKCIGLNKFCKRHMRIPGSVVQFDRFWGYMRNILVCQKGEGEDPLIVKILVKPVMTGIARPWPPSESGTIGYVSAENHSTGECFNEGLDLTPFGKAHLSQMFLVAFLVWNMQFLDLSYISGHYIKYWSIFNLSSQQGNPSSPCA